MVQIIVLAAVAFFLFWRLKSVLGSRQGFEKVNKNAGTMGVAFTSCTVPAAGKPTFVIGDDEIEFGVGIHGEPGRKREKIQPSKTIVGNILDAIIKIKPKKINHWN